MDRQGTLINPQTLQFVRLLPGPIERVWDYLTDAEMRKQWFCGGSSALLPGKEVSFVFHNSQLGSPSHPTPEKYQEYGDGFESKAVVVKAEKPHLFVIKWEGVVTFQLEEKGDEVQLTLTHENMSDSRDARVGTLAGWHTHLDLLEEVLHNRTPFSFWPAHMRQEEAYEQLVT